MNLPASPCCLKCESTSIIFLLFVFVNVPQRISLFVISNNLIQNHISGNRVVNLLWSAVIFSRLKPPLILLLLAFPISVTYTRASYPLFIYRVLLLVLLGVLLCCFLVLAFMLWVLLVHLYLSGANLYNLSVISFNSCSHYSGHTLSCSFLWLFSILGEIVLLLCLRNALLSSLIASLIVLFFLHKYPSPFSFVAPFCILCVIPVYSFAMFLNTNAFLWSSCQIKQFACCFLFLLQLSLLLLSLLFDSIFIVLPDYLLFIVIDSLRYFIGGVICFTFFCSCFSSWLSLVWLLWNLPLYSSYSL